jgi:hypothetical protein
MYTTLLFITVSITVFTVSAELHQNKITVDATDRENWAYINLTEGETVDIADPANSMPRVFVEFEPASIDANGKLATTWASMKLK